MKKWLKYSTAFVLICIGILFLFFFLFRTGYNRYYSHENGMLEETINGNHDYDILLLGSSRTCYHINPKVVDSVTQMSSYNVGIAGAKFPEMIMILQCYLKNHKPPKYLIMDIPHAGFDPDQRPIYNPNMYYPYLDNDIVYNSLKSESRVGLLKHLPFLQLTEADDAMRQGAILGLLGGKSLNDSEFYKGYLQNGTDTLKLPFKKSFKNINKPVREEGIALFKQIIEICKKNNIKILAMYPPVYKFSNEDMNPEFFPKAEEVCKTYGIPFINYWQIPMSQDHTLFQDEIHLNKSGADIFSEIIAKDFLKIL
jgi:hypothetical protein